MEVYARKLSRAFHQVGRETLAARANRTRPARSNTIDERFDAMLDRLDAPIIEVGIWMAGVHVILFCALMAIDFLGH